MSDLIDRQDAINEIEYELEMINSALDSITLDFNARERLHQRRGEAREILNSIQQLPSAQPKPGKWINGHWDGDSNFRIDGRGNCWFVRECSNCHEEIEGKPTKYCPNCGCRMDGEQE